MPQNWGQNSGFYHFFKCYLKSQRWGTRDTNLQIAIVLLGREGGSEQPGRAEQWSPGRACFCPGEGQHLLQKLNQSCAAQQYSSSCREKRGEAASSLIPLWCSVPDRASSI